MNYRVILKINDEIKMKYFVRLRNAYYWLNDEFYIFLNNYDVDEDCIEFEHEVVFGHIIKKEDYYEQEDDKIEKDIDLLFKNHHLDLLVLASDENRFMANLVKI